MILRIKLQMDAFILRILGSEDPLGHYFHTQAASKSTETQALKKSACATSQCPVVYSQMSDKSHPNAVNKRIYFKIL